MVADRMAGRGTQASNGDVASAREGHCACPRLHAYATGVEANRRRPTARDGKRVGLSSQNTYGAASSICTATECCGQGEVGRVGISAVEMDIQVADSCVGDTRRKICSSGEHGVRRAGPDALGLEMRQRNTQRECGEVAE